jgi:hypothetical protein
MIRGGREAGAEPGVGNAPEGEFSWQAHPARERIGHAAAALVAVMAMGVLSGLLMQSSLWGVLAVALLMLALNRFFFPSRFIIDGEGITAHYPLRRKRLCWTDLRRFARDESGGYLSTRVRPSRLDAYRGMHILFGREREAILTRIREHLPQGTAS